MRASTRVGAVLFSALVSSFAQAADSFPSKSIRFIVPFAPIGGVDVTARAIAGALSESWNQQIIVDNRPGAATVIGTALAAKATPDGYTLLMVSATHAINPFTQKDLPYDTEKSFMPVTFVGELSNVLLVNPALPVRNVNELVELAKKNPKKMNYGSAGNASASHVAGAMFRHMTKTEMVHVPYKGGGPALTGLLGGHVELYFSTLPAAIPLVRSDKLRGLAVTSAKRSLTLPELPTVAEAGVAGYESVWWLGILVPAQTPQAIIQKLNIEIVRILKTPGIQKNLVDQGIDPVIASSSAEFTQILKNEFSRWSRVAKEIGLNNK